MIKAGPTWAIIEYEKEESHVEVAGILVPSKRTQRLNLKGTSRTISRDADVEIPDVVRAGTLVSGDIGFPIGTTVLFNKHDAYGFELDTKYFYAIKAELVMAALSTPTKS